MAGRGVSLGGRVQPSLLLLNLDGRFPGHRRRHQVVGPVGYLGLEPGHPPTEPPTGSQPPQGSTQHRLFRPACHQRITLGLRHLQLGAVITGCRPQQRLTPDHLLTQPCPGVGDISLQLLQTFLARLRPAQLLVVAPRALAQPVQLRSDTILRLRDAGIPRPLHRRLEVVDRILVVLLRLLPRLARLRDTVTQLAHSLTGLGPHPCGLAIGPSDRILSLGLQRGVPLVDRVPQRRIVVHSSVLERRPVLVHPRFRTRNVVLQRRGPLFDCVSQFLITPGCRGLERGLTDVLSSAVFAGRRAGGRVCWVGDGGWVGRGMLDGDFFRAWVSGRGSGFRDTSRRCSGQVGGRGGRGRGSRNMFRCLLPRCLRGGCRRRGAGRCRRRG